MKSQINEDEWQIRLILTRLNAILWYFKYKLLIISIFWIKLQILHKFIKYYM